MLDRALDAGQAFAWRERWHVLQLANLSSLRGEDRFQQRHGGGVVFVLVPEIVGLVDDGRGLVVLRDPSTDVFAPTLQIRVHRTVVQRCIPDGAVPFQTDEVHGLLQVSVVVDPARQGVAAQQRIGDAYRWPSAWYSWSVRAPT